MQRTRITTKLLVGLAVTAVSGCVTVEPGAVPSPRPGVGGPVQDVAPQIVQPPAREALEAVPDPAPSPPAVRRSSSAPPAAGSSTAPRRAGAFGSARPEPPHRRAPHRPRAEPPVAVPALPRVPGGADVCALGRGYGMWPAGSPQSRICSEVYGR
ncbi:hypothetical protein [Streptomyces sp. NPDC017448]|uniref:hypothetical protein n=1 Tax=Streptomyces sp. NPDC017448 TaxID=3364996 RepID=UPI0037915E39